MRSALTLGVLVSLLAFSALAQPATDLTKEPTLYVVGYAHLDTEWRWEYPQTIGEFLPNTLHDNFALFEKYPHYIFNFSGANRYRLMREYYPADYAKMRGYVKAGRWFPAGSSMEESDVNSPSAESIMRQVLYGSRYFRRDLGRTSAEYMLPDCFGFPASLPSLLAHMGIKGFSTQKLTWGSAAPVGGPDSPEKTPRGTPFNVGIWEGPDGRSVMAALNPGDYSADITYDLTSSDKPENVRRFVDWPARVRRNGEVSGLFTDYHYYGTGDVGGSPSESSVKIVESLVTKQAPLRVVSATADRMFLDITPEWTSRLPRYKGELELTQHSAGSLTSQAYQKRWNHRNEVLADAAEKVSVAASWLGAREYPQQRLEDAWTLVMGGQFHDIAAGTSTPKAYEYSWNDEVIAMNQFAGVLTDATEAVARGLDTRVEGTPMVVFNALNIEREDIVEAEMPGIAAAEVFGPDGKEVPAQVSNGKVIFVAKAPPVGFAVYDVRRPSANAARQGARRSQSAASALHITESSLENARYRITLDTNGDVRSIFDKKLNRELLSAPIRLAFQTEKPYDWPAWNMDWKDQKLPPRAFVGGPATVRVVENGPARVALEVSRQGEKSRFAQTIRLSAGDAGNRVEFADSIDWRTEAAALKATFPLAASNPMATYNWEVGTIERGNNEETRYEVATHDWFDLTDKGGAFGVTVLTGGKYGSDKPADDTVRLTLLYTPGLGEGNGRSYADQTSQDFGHHEIVYGLASHEGNWRSGRTDWQGLRLSQPLIAFAAPQNRGFLGKKFSLLRVDNPAVRVLALKQAEESDDVIVRIVEVDGKASNDVRLSFAAPVRSARETDGQEMPLGTAKVDNGQLVTSMKPFQLRTFAVKLAPPAQKIAAPQSRAVTLAYERAVATSDGAKPSPGFDSAGRSIDAAMLPDTIAWGGIRFTLASPSGANALVAHGQTIDLPAGASRVYVLAAADGERSAAFRLGDESEKLAIQDWAGFIGQWDTRKWYEHDELLPPRPDAPPDAPPRTRKAVDFAGLTPGFIKRAPVAWFASHLHSAEGKNVPYNYSYLYAHSFEVPNGATKLQLPDDDHVRILAVTTSNEGPAIRPVQPLYDRLTP